MPILGIIVWLLVLGVVLWGIKAAPFIDDGIKKLIYVFVVVIVMLILINTIFPGVLGINTPRVR